MFCAFWLENVLRATAACHFSFPRWTATSAPAALASLLFEHPEPRIIEKTQRFATFLTFAACFSSFQGLYSRVDRLSSDLTSLLCFSAVHIVGKLDFSKLPSTKAPLQYYSGLQSTTPSPYYQVLLCTTKYSCVLKCLTWNGTDIARSNKCHPLTWPNTAPVNENGWHASSSSHMKCHLITMRGATGVTLQPHQILRLPRKWHLHGAAPAKKSDPWTSPNVAPATKSDIWRIYYLTNPLRDESITLTNLLLDESISWRIYYFDESFTWRIYYVTNLLLHYSDLIGSFSSKFPVTRHSGVYISSTCASKDFNTTHTHLQDISIWLNMSNMCMVRLCRPRDAIDL